MDEQVGLLVGVLSRCSSVSAHDRAAKAAKARVKAGPPQTAQCQERIHLVTRPLMSTDHLTC